MKRLLQDAVLWVTDRKERWFLRAIQITDAWLDWLYEKTV